MRPELSPDGKKVAFESNRLGFWDLWTCEIEKGDCNQITSLHGTAGRARWSPNGRYIAFEFHPNEHSEIYIVEVPGGVPHLLPTIPGADNLSPSWSRDGKWLYFASKRGTDAFQIWKIPVQAGDPVQVTRHGGISAVESTDGRYLYYSKFEEGGVWRMPVQGHEETRCWTLVEMAGQTGHLAQTEYTFSNFLSCHTRRLSFLVSLPAKLIPYGLWRENLGGASASQAMENRLFLRRMISRSRIL